jgi:hypothetical protein
MDEEKLYDLLRWMVAEVGLQPLPQEDLAQLWQYNAAFLRDHGTPRGET